MLKNKLLSLLLVTSVLCNSCIVYTASTGDNLDASTNVLVDDSARSFLGSSIRQWVGSLSALGITALIIYLFWDNIYGSMYDDFFGPGYNTPEAAANLRNACLDGDLTRAKNIMKGVKEDFQGFLVTEKDPTSRKTAMYYACEGPSLELVKLLMEKVDNTNNLVISCTGIHNTILHAACQSTNPEIFKYIVNAKVQNIDDKTLWLDNKTPLHIASECGREDLARWLIEQKGADVDIEAGRFLRGDTPLIAATKKKRTAVMKLLLEKGADVDSKDFDKKTAFIIACENKDLKSVKLLVKKGADIHQKGGKFWQDSPLKSGLTDKKIKVFLKKKAQRGSGKKKKKKI